jgi:hypothetical protein
MRYKNELIKIFEMYPNITWDIIQDKKINGITIVYYKIQI